MGLKKAEIEKFKLRLEEMKRQLTHTIEGGTEAVKKPDEATGYSQHQADQGTDDFDRRVSIELTSKEFDVLRLIDRALEKIEENTYGICDITGDEIPYPRLDAVPYATMTVQAQEQFEKGLLTE
ncbi:MAG: General stress protein 16O [Chlamydiales bacterium]|nr:General stress protein 16O [Chlamydiales bacterium]MCH9619250.1 General stress protein 16O [Chlamydiales bacterium]MCH9622512.1 General stress protein 16O [Chlamydiales bacterium]